MLGAEETSVTKPDGATATLQDHRRVASCLTSPWYNRISCPEMNARSSPCAKPPLGWSAKKLVVILFDTRTVSRA